VSTAKGLPDGWQPPSWARGELHRAFPRDPSRVNDTPDPGGTVGPETAPTTELAAPVGAEPPILDGDALGAAVPTPKGFVPSPWAGYPSTWGTAWGNWSGAGGIADPVLGRKVSTVFSCVELNANALGSMPVTISENGRPIDPAQYEWTENPDPRLYSGWDEFVVQWAASMWTRGEAFVCATGMDWSTFLPNTFMVLDPDRVTVQFDSEGQRVYQLSGEPLFGLDVLHTRYMTLAGWPNGLSPLQAAAGNLRSAGALEQYGASLAESGGIPWGVLTSEQRLSGRQARLARQQYREQRAELTGDPVVLGYGLSLDTLNLSPRDMALLDLRVFDEQRIASVLGVPPWLVGLPQPEGMTYANALSLFGFHWRRLRPIAKRLTNGLSSWALPRGRRAALNAGDYVQPELVERANAYKTMHEGGALTDDEWRALENLPPLTPAQRRELAGASNGPGQQAAPAVANATVGSAVTQ
jgi:HK97 family phage portal protein